MVQEKDFIVLGTLSVLTESEVDNSGGRLLQLAIATLVGPCCLYDSISENALCTQQLAYGSEVNILFLLPTPLKYDVHYIGPPQHTSTGTDCINSLIQNVKTMM